MFAMTHLSESLTAFLGRLETYLPSNTVVLEKDLNCTLCNDSESEPTDQPTKIPHSHRFVPMHTLLLFPPIFLTTLTNPLLSLKGVFLLVQHR